MKAKGSPNLRERPSFHFERRLTWIGLGLGAWVVFRILLHFPHAADALVDIGPTSALGRGLSRITGTVPVSLVELLVLAVVVRQLLGAAGGLRQIREGIDTWSRTVARGGLRLAQDAGILVLLFYLLWGFQYARPGLAHHLDLEVAGELSATDLASLAGQAVRATNRAYLELHGAADAGFPTPTLPPDSLVSAIEAGWASVREELGLPDRLERRYGTPKPLMASPILKRMGLRGVYSPFTGEALVLRDLPGSQMGVTLAHEMAHQRGVTSESDANVLAFLVASRSTHPQVRYAAHRFLEGQLVVALMDQCLPCAETLAQQRLPGVRRDLRHSLDYWAAARGPVREMASRANHAMLRSHGIPEGTASYRGSTWVLAALALRDGPEVLFGEEVPADSVPGSMPGAG